MNANERFEYMAEQFYKKTGMLAPGKDCPAEFALSDDDIAERDLQWRLFVEGFYANLFQTHADMYEMLEKCQQKFEGLGYYTRVEEIESLLKRARDE